jgi:Mlc titration factor MtfA (ptsG expression regulator)
MTNQHIYSTLLSEFPYFKKLDVKKRELLCSRTAEFIKLTKFVGKQNLEVTDKMKILIAACSQQLTLSFKRNYLYNHFERILVYPEKYFSPFSKTHNIGEMNTAGVIVFSWPDFYNGIKLDDNRNVGLHEFAHALEFIDIANKDTDDRFSYALDKEFMVAYDYIKNRPEEIFFRSYAATNRAEFFAVATEYFFESPVDFSRAHPTIYALFCKIYGQDPRPSQVSFAPYSSPPVKEKGDLWFGYGGTESISFYEEAMVIPNDAIYRLFYSLFMGINKPRAEVISFDDVFSGNVTGDLDYDETIIKSRSYEDNLPVLTLRYYVKGKIESVNIGLVSLSDRMSFLRKLYMKKKVCIRINGQIKRFELQ